MKKVIALGVVLGSIPFFVFAADVFSIIATIQTILNYIIPVLIALATVYFVWGVIQYTVSTDEEAKKGARGKIINGLIGLFIIVAFWGIIRVVISTFGVSNQNQGTFSVPCIPGPGVNCQDAGTSTGF